MTKTSGLCAALALAPFAAAAAMAQAPVKVPEAQIALVPPTGYAKIDRAKLPPAAQQAIFAYYGPMAGKFRANMNLTLHTLPAGMKIKADPEAASHLGDSFKQTATAYKQIAVGPVTVNGEKGAYMVCSFVLQNVPVQSKQVIFVRNGKAYDFCFMSAASAYAGQIGKFDKSVASVKWQ